MGLNFYDYHDFQKKARGNRIMNNTVLLEKMLTRIFFLLMSRTQNVKKKVWVCKGNGKLKTL